MSKLVLVRHAQTDANKQGLLQGLADNPLNDTGRMQAKQLAKYLQDNLTSRPPQKIISSPLIRAVETAEICNTWGLAIETNQQVIELDYGDYDGTPIAEVPAADWRQWWSDPSFRPPQGESLEQLQKRTNQFLAVLAAQELDCAIVFTHVSPIKAAISFALGGDELMAWRLRVKNAAVSTLELGERPVLTSFNEFAPEDN